MPRDRALYVIVRKDLSKSSLAAQAAHATAQFVLDHPGTWLNGTIVLLLAKNEGQLGEILHAYGNSLVSEFREPDLEGTITAIAILGPEEHADSAFPMLRLL